MKTNKLLAGAFILAMAAACATAQASTYTCTGGALTIPDTNTWVSAVPTSCTGTSTGFVRKVTLRLTFTHPRPSDLHFIVGANSVVDFQRDAWVMGAAGGSTAFTGTITLDDAAAITLPNSALTNNQSYKPARYDTTVPPPPAATPANLGLFTLDGSVAASFTLYALDHVAGGGGSVTSWTLTVDLTATPYANFYYEIPEIFWQNTSLGQVQGWGLYYGTNPGFIATSNYNVNGNWHLATSGDYNGDGNADLVWVNDTTHDVQVWLMTGQTVTATRGYNVGAGWQLAASGHFYPRNVWDLVWVNQSAGAMQIWFMDDGGTGNVAGSQNYSFGPGWALQDVGDFYGRGQHDLLWRGPGTAQIWSMDGAVIRSATNFNVPAGWEVGGVGDLDGDGRDDIIWVNASLGLGQMWLMNGDTIAAAQNFNLPPAPWMLLNVQPYRITGTANLAWYNPSINTIQVWSMNGFTITNAANYAAGPGWTPH